jgi:hypothetical protein
MAKCGVVWVAFGKRKILIVHSSMSCMGVNGEGMHLRGGAAMCCHPDDAPGKSSELWSASRPVAGEEGDTSPTTGGRRGTRTRRGRVRRRHAFGLDRPSGRPAGHDATARERMHYWIHQTPESSSNGGPVCRAARTRALLAVRLNSTTRTYMWRHRRRTHMART